MTDYPWQRDADDIDTEVERMTTAAFEHKLPWTEEDWLALGETSDRVELLDGSLLVSPSPIYWHQRVARRLANALDAAAGAAGLEVYEAVNVRLRAGRLVIPDIVVMTPIDGREVMGDASAVRLICEITSPSNAGTDRVLKMHHYAEAGIPQYLLVDHEPFRLRLFELDGKSYAGAGIARPGQTLRFGEPLRLELDPVTLLRR